MPPPPLSIPQNTNPIPTAVTSPMNNGHRMNNPPSAGGMVRRAAPELNKRNLYVGGLDQSINEQVLKQIFETAGHVVSVKVIPEKGVSPMPACAATSALCMTYFMTRLLMNFSSKVKGSTMDLLNTTIPRQLKMRKIRSTVAKFTTRWDTIPSSRRSGLTFDRKYA